jgi:RNA polymerase sigma-70 factor (ECF subfamily)
VRPTKPEERAITSAPFRDWNREGLVIGLATSSARVRRLVAAAREGDRDAFAELYRMHHAPITRMVRFHAPPGEVEDAVAETFVRAWAGLPRYRDTGAPFAAWLYGIARHVTADLWRGTTHSEARAEVPDRAVDHGDREEDRMDLALAVARLGEEQRTVIELKFLLGLSNEEVGRALGKSPGAVNALQWRAMVALREILRPR